MSPLTALFVFISAVVILLTTAVLSFFVGSEKAFELVVVLILIYFILGFVQYMRNYNREHYEEEIYE